MAGIVDRQDADTTVWELVGMRCDELLALPGSDQSEVFVLFARVEGVWYRAFIDVGVFFLSESECEPSEELPDGGELRDLAAELSCKGQRISHFAMHDGVLDLTFASGAGLTLKGDEEDASRLTLHQSSGLPT